NNVFSLEIISQQVSTQFLYYALKNLEGSLQATAKGGGVPYISWSDLAAVRIPVPPLEVQREIVKILDQFTQLEAELEAELEARRAQHVHYRQSLFSYDESVPMRPLGELGRNLDNLRRPVTKESRVPGSIPYYGASGIVDFVSEFIFDGDYL